jgi:hypothetical protein
VTPLYSILLDIKVVRTLLIFIGAIGLAVIYFVYRKKDIGTNQAKGPLVLLDLEKKASAPLAEHTPAAPSEDIAAPIPEPTPQAPTFKAFQQRYWTLSDLYRAFLILLSLIVAAGFVLILLPQSSIDRMAHDIRALDGASQQESIALLSFGGDEVGDRQFEIRGAVRNISNAPIEHLDAAIRLKSYAGIILETVLVRMDKDILAPDEIGQFRLVCPHSKTELSSYAVEFKLRHGPLMAYKDLHKAHEQSNRNP